MSVLSKHFRQPKLFITLPSNGKWWPEGSITFPENKEIPVLSMTGKDDLILKNADALMNGSATVEMIQSCMPNIKNAWVVPRSDLDIIILAIRIATYGPSLKLESKCPHCNAINDNEVDCRWIMENIQQPNWDKVANIGELTFELRPLNFRDINSINIDSYEENRMLQQLAQQNLTSDQRAEIISKTMKKVAANLNIRLSASIAAIITPSFEKVTNQTEIIEFITQSDKEMFDKIKHMINEYVAEYKIPKLTVQCESCNQTYDTTIDFDPANFFAPDY
jgi:hypothetical protein